MQHIIDTYHTFAEPAIKDRFFKHSALQPLLDVLPETFSVETIGQSAEGRAQRLVIWGAGPLTVFLWSQMHGDEPTGTMVLFDLFRFLQSARFQNEWQAIGRTCKLVIFPMVNPDGAERFTRRSAQAIDINRDFLQTVTPEAALLRYIRDRFQPSFGFNLHDQSTLWSVADFGKPASLSYLAPADQADLSFGAVRTKAANIIAEIFDQVSPMLPGQIGLFDDSHEPRAFGDNFQKAGTSTILIEAGGLEHDKDKQVLRRYFFLSILAGLKAIALGAADAGRLEDYLAIPKNSGTLLHIIIREVRVNGLTTDIGLVYEERPNDQADGVTEYYFIKDIGDLSVYQAYEEFRSEQLSIDNPVAFEAPADFNLYDGSNIILSFQKGLRNKNFILS
ncbi:M14 family zinc carboxypeptidase [Pedobacter sp. SYP-B3415]|uniref:M14 family zinc carboxypeptidase n=1 Tax=Pedobacter sp. SYP-B3415 TaxID=2496641 RepID=UPI00101CA547|nr:M14 family zinc carboxypeptidase [Pedobacter sp. SYP-B3415]